MRHCMRMYGWIWNISVTQYKEICRNICRVRVVCSNRLENGIRVRQQVDSQKYVRISKNMWVGKIIFGVTPRWQLHLRNCAHRSRKHFIFPKVKFDETNENLVTTKENVCRFRMKNFTKEANFFKGLCKKALLMISKFIDLGSLMSWARGNSCIGGAWSLYLFSNNLSVVTNSTIPSLTLKKKHNAIAYHHTTRLERQLPWVS